jgi:hypothetical protein
MTGIYLTGGIIIAGLLFANRNVIINNALIILFGLFQTVFTIFPETLRGWVGLAAEKN